MGREIKVTEEKIKKSVENFFKKKSIPFTLRGWVFEFENNKKTLFIWNKKLFGSKENGNVLEGICLEYDSKEYNEDIISIAYRLEDQIKNPNKYKNGKL